MQSTAFRPYLVLLGVPARGRSCARVPSVYRWCYAPSKAACRSHYSRMGFSVSGVLTTGEYDIAMYWDVRESLLCKKLHVSRSALPLLFRAHSFEKTLARGIPTIGNYK